jgi:hypothetical protein
MKDLQKDAPELWPFIPMLRAGSMRWLLVAGATWLASVLGIPEAIAPQQAEQWVELAVKILEGAAIAWAGYHRYANPTPPLAFTKKGAEKKNREMADVALEQQKETGNE